MNDSFAISRTVENPLVGMAAALVGIRSLLDAQDSVKRAMVAEALTRTQGNFTHAAVLLGVKRQAVQQMVSRYDLQHWAESTRGPRRRSTLSAELSRSANQ
jgi:transcriptional regulator with GAF, ATPase, and Fis domain